MASNTLARLWVDLEARTQPFQDGINSVSDRMEQFGSRLTNVGTNLTAKITAPIVGLGAAAFKMGADAAESASKLEAVYGPATDAVNASIAGLRDTIPETTANLQGMFSGIQDLLVPLGLTPDAASKMTEQVVRLAGDLASFNNIPMAEALEKIRSGLVGQNEPLLSFGVAIDAAAVKTRALEMGLINEGDALDANARAQAAFSLIVEKTTAAQGDAAKTADSAANSLKFFWAETKEAAAILGAELLPVLTPIIQNITVWIKKFQDLDAGTKKIILVVAGLTAAIGPVLIAMGSIISAGGAVLGVLAALVSPIGLVVAALAGLVAGGVALIRHWDEVMGIARRVWDTIDSLLGPIDELVIALARMAAAWIELWVKLSVKVLSVVREIAEGVIGWLVEHLAPLATWVWDRILKPMIDVWAEGLNNIFGVVQGAVEKVTGAFEWLSDTLVGNSVIPDMMELIKGAFVGMADDMETHTLDGTDRVMSGFDSLLSHLPPVVQSVLDEVKGIWGEIDGVLNGPLDGVVSDIQGGVGKWWDYAKGVVGVFSSIWDNIGGWIDKITGFLSGGGLSSVVGGGASGGGGGGGSSAGGAIGTLVGGPVGGIIGSILGSAIGGLFGNDEQKLLREAVNYWGHEQYKATHLWGAENNAVLRNMLVALIETRDAVRAGGGGFGSSAGVTTAQRGAGYTVAV